MVNRRHWVAENYMLVTYRPPTEFDTAFDMTADTPSQAFRKARCIYNARTGKWEYPKK